MKNIKKFFLKNRQKIDNKEIVNNKIVNHNIDKYGEIGKLVREARLRKGISIKDLSDMSKIPASTINAIENNLRELGLGDVAVNKKMKNLNKIFYDILLKINNSNDNFTLNKKLIL